MNARMPATVQPSLLAPEAAAGSTVSSLAGRAVMLLALCLQLYSWSLLEGYQIADSVEYMEHAQALARGERVIDSTNLRAAGFATILAPLFWLAERLGVERYDGVVTLVRIVQLLLALWLLRTTLALGDRLGGRGTALGAGLVVALNPIYLQYSVEPVAGVAAGVAVANALAALYVARDRRRGLRAGLWLAGALLMAYQTIIVVAPITLLELLRNRRRDWRQSAWILLGICVGLAFQVAFDRWRHGAWGATLVRYFLENFSGQTAKWLHRFGLTDLARRVYELGVQANTPIELDPERMRSLTPPTWYIVHLPQMFAWPLLLGLAAGVWRSLRRPSWLASTCLLVFTFNFVLMSQKGSKDFRLWLPLLPFLAPIMGHGLAWLAGNAQERGACLRRLLVLLLLSFTMHQSTGQLGARNTRKFSGYWQAVDLVLGCEAEAPTQGRKPRLGSAYHWAVFGRGSHVVDLVKLPHQLNLWQRYDAAQQNENVRTLLGLDWFIVHLPVLTENPDLMRIVNNQFEIAGLFWDYRDYEDIGPIFVLHRNREEHSRRFFQVFRDRDPKEYASSEGLGEPIEFVRTLHLPDPITGEVVEHHEQIDFLGFEYEVLPGDGHGWITYHWACRTPIVADYTIVDRVTTIDETNAWQNNHAPAYGVHPTASSKPGGWQAGWIVRESWPLVAAAEPFEYRKPLRPLGGDWRRGDLMPASLWIDLATFGPDPAREGALCITGRMEPARKGTGVALRSGAEQGSLRTSDGWWFSKDDLVRVGRFFLPVHPRARVPDNGRPLPP